MRLAYSALQKMVELRYRNQTELGQIFMFHQILNSSHNPSNNIMCLGKDEFSKFVNLLLKNGTIRSIQELNDSGQIGDYYLTFDDIYVSAVDNALGWLTDMRIPFTIFITLNYLDKDNYISTNQLRELARNKYCTIGSHTLTHPLLRFMKYEEVKYEITRSKEELEFIIGNGVDYFAYPYGSKYACSKQVIEVAQQAGYKYAFSTYSMGINRKYLRNNPYFIPRINVDHDRVKEMEAYYESKS
ncbi:MAG: polysaccharide deacetylase family protein [Bacillota bacterium]